MEKELEEKYRRVLDGDVGSEVSTIGYLDPRVFEGVCNLRTTGVIVSDRQLAHILSAHPAPVEHFTKHMPLVLDDPTYIIAGNYERSVVMLRELPNEDIRFCLVLKLASESDPLHFQNSISSCWVIRKEEYERLVRNKKVLYRRLK